MNAKGDKRKRTAILSADVVGNRRLMGDDAEGSISILTYGRRK